MFRDEERIFKDKAYRYFLFGLLAIAVSFFISDFIVSEIAKYADISGDLREAIGETFRLAMLIVVIFAAHMQGRIFASNWKSFVHGLLTGFPILAIAILQLVLSLIQADPGYFSNTELVCSTIVTYSLTGIFEELLFRGVVLNAFQDAFATKCAKTIWASLILSALAFGLMHLTNLASGQNVVGTLMQVIEATAVGLCFGAVYLRCRNIWTVVILHALTDLSGAIGTNARSTTDVQNTNVNAAASILSILPSIIILLGLTFFFLRRSKMEEMIEENHEGGIEASQA
ncbi:MAG: CPBP family intramembrane metalloprotease [Mobilibacterium timonense]|uniref:CPBP family intramembrane glutamic endopeptidase n=1 Tax=Mobilibacterium timonense TaxID=1871012 RepID=UPI0013563985|nr:type II CAAX endopeptidase family protein [Mobilibacterium timonense]MBM6991411.1 CPBP family intramembrane metalloprotease [Mobilibacterium timonense]